MDIKKILPPRRRLTFFLIFTLVIAIFFIGYNFYYIPGNQDIVHKNAFLILGNISRNIKERNDYLQEAFKNILKPDTGTDHSRYLKEKQQQLNLYNLNGRIFPNGHLASRDSLFRSVPDSTVYLAGIHNDSLHYISADKNVREWIYVPAQNFISPSIASQKKELLEAYILLHNNAGSVYADDILGINKGIAADSLIADKKEALFAGIKDIQIKGNKFKMFYYPFRLGNEDVVLCGFLKYETYFKKLHQVPVSFIYPIIIILLLLLIMMPIVKYYLMGKDEQISFTDFVLAVVSFFTGATIITIIIIQVLLLLAADVRTKENLNSIACQIENSFNLEIKKMYLQAGILDSAIKADPLTKAFSRMPHAYNFNASDIIKKYFNHHPKDTDLYYNFNRVAWVDEEGNQGLKGQTIPGKQYFANVSSRDYFKIVNQNQGYPVPGIPGARFGFEPLNSLTNGDFNIVISEKNGFGHGWTTTLSAPMYSVLRTILPPGYGFCITGEDGRVLLHSETNRSLQENIIENADPSRQIAEAIKSRQEAFFPNLNLYGKTNALHVKPITGMPLHLLTFYDKGYIVPVNMRILSFSLVFCSITFATCLMMWFGFRKRKKKIYTSLLGPMHRLKWILPKESNLEFYVLGIFFLLANLLFQIIVTFSFKLFDISNYGVLVLTVVMPVNIYTGLFVINYRVRKDMPATDLRHKLLPSKKIVAIILLQLLVSIAAWFGSSQADYPIHAGFLFFSFLFNLFLWLIFLLPAGTFSFLNRTSKEYLNQYAIYATLLILSLTAWPAALYTWYAHNQEITQSVKKEQLYLADALRQRADLNHEYYDTLMELNPPDGYIDTLQLSAGIYTIYQDKVAVIVDTLHTKDESNLFEHFYFSIANEIGNNYYDPLMIPVLKDNATGNEWHWSKKNEADSLDEGDSSNKIFFTYHMYTHPHVTEQNKVTRNTRLALYISSTFPSRYIFIKPSFGGFLLLLLVAAIVYGLFRLLRYISYHLFLIKFIAGTKEDEAGRKEKMLQMYHEFKIYRESVGQAVNITATDVLQLKNEYDFYKASAATDEYQMETTMISTLAKYKHFFDFLWGRFSSAEKYLLLNYAQNGFINFKNTEVINHMLQSGIFIIEDEELKMFSVSFRAYILKHKNSEEMLQLRTVMRQESTWQSFRMPLLFIILGVALFIFITQEQTFQKITALLTGVTTVFTLVMKFISDGTNLFSSKK